MKVLLSIVSFCVLFIVLKWIYNNFAPFNTVTNVLAIPLMFVLLPLISFIIGTLLTDYFKN